MMIMYWWLLTPVLGYLTELDTSELANVGMLEEDSEAQKGPAARLWRSLVAPRRHATGASDRYVHVVPKGIAQRLLYSAKCGATSVFFHKRVELKGQSFDDKEYTPQEIQDNFMCKCKEGYKGGATTITAPLNKGGYAYRGQLYNPRTGKFDRGAPCELAPCPAHANCHTDLDARVQTPGIANCKQFYEGTIEWNAKEGKWDGTCAKAAPEPAAPEPADTDSGRFSEISQDSLREEEEEELKANHEAHRNGKLSAADWDKIFATNTLESAEEAIRGYNLDRYLRPECEYKFNQLELKELRDLQKTKRSGRIKVDQEARLTKLEANRKAELFAIIRREESQKNQIFFYDEMGDPAFEKPTTANLELVLRHLCMDGFVDDFNKKDPKPSRDGPEMDRHAKALLDAAYKELSKNDPDAPEFDKVTAKGGKRGDLFQPAGLINSLAFASRMAVLPISLPENPRSHL